MLLYRWWLRFLQNSSFLSTLFSYYYYYCEYYDWSAEKQLFYNEYLGLKFSVIIIHTATSSTGFLNVWENCE